MKQGHSSLYDRLHHKTVENLFPDTPYRFDSGGVPKEIVTLTHQDLLDFHKDFYHPSKALIFLYGNLDIDEQLQKIEDSIKNIPLSDKPALTRVYQSPFSTKKIVHTHYPATKDETAKHLTIGFVVGDQKNQERLLEILYLKMLLADHDACPLQRGIMGEDLASSVEVLTDMEVLQPYIYFTFKDVTDPEKLVATFDQILHHCYEQGFFEEARHAALHQLKISFLNTVEDGYPTGLIFFFRALLPSLNGSDPLKMLKFKERIETLEKAMAQPENIQKILKEAFLENNHRVEIHFSPKENLLEEELPTPLKITEAMEEVIQEETKLIEAKQKRSHDASILPILHMHQLPKKPFSYSLEKQEGSVPIFIHRTWTNGLSYIDLFIDLPDFKTEEIRHLGLLIHLLGQIGADGLSFEELIERKESIVSSFSVSIEPIQNRLVLVLSMETLSENITNAFQLIRDILTQTEFGEKERVEEILKDLYTHLKSRFTQRAVGRCILKSKSLLKTGYEALEELKGFSFYLWLKQIVEQPVDSLLKPLKEVFNSILLGRGLQEMTLTTDLEKIPVLDFKIEKTDPPFENIPLALTTRHQFFGYKVPLQANENAFSFPGFSFDDPASPYARIAVQLVKHLQIHPLLRELHGAYGASMSYDLDQGIFTMFTSCDPNIDLTYKIFLEVLKPIGEGLFSEADLYEAKLAALQKTDGISSLNMRASDQYWLNRLGRTEEKRILHRNRLIEADTSAIRECVSKIMGNLMDAVSVTVASKKALESVQMHPTTLVEL
jgi:Zn-dependent M16 (insulinase) family peptidase